MSRHALSRAIGAFTALALVVGGFAVTAAPASAAAKKGSISGVISSEGDTEGSSIGTDGIAVLGKWVADGKYYNYSIDSEADETGAYEFTGLAAGRYSVRFVTHSGRWISEYWDNVEVDGPVTPTAINLAAGQNVVASPELAQAATISGVVTGSDSEGVELDWASVSAFDAETGLGVGWVGQQEPEDELTGYTVSYLTPGTYRLHVEAEWGGNYVSQWYGGSTYESATDVTVEGGDQLTDFDVELALGGVISGTISTPNSDDLSIQASAYDPEGNIVATGDVFGGGYEITNLPAGDYRVGFKSSRYASEKIVPEFYENAETLEAAQTVTVTPGETIGDIDPELDVAPTFTASPRPTITGTASVGSTLTAKVGAWTPSGATFAYGWSIDGEQVGTSPTYTVVPADAGKRIVVEVEGSLEGYGSVVKYSKFTAVVAKGTITAVTPKLTGTAKVGSTLTAVTGEWKPATATLGYTWLRDGKAITGGTAASYTLTAGDKGKKISVKVKGTGDGLTSKSATSKSKLVAAGVLVAPAAPVVTGTARVGETLTGTSGPWAPDDTVVSYQWKSDKKAIKGATSPALVVPGTVAGTKLTLTVTGKKAGYTTVSKTSVATTAVAKADLVVGEAPAFIGDPTVGATLTASAAGWEDTTKLSYQWLRSGSKIAGATKASYVVSRSDRGHSITVKLVASRTGYNSVTLAGTSTVAVAAVVATVNSEPVDWEESDYFSVYIYETTPRVVTIAGGEYFEFQAEPGFFESDDVQAAVAWSKGKKSDGKVLTATVSDDASTLRVKVPTGSTLATLKAKKKAGYALELQVLAWSGDYSVLNGVFTVLKF